VVFFSAFRPVELARGCHIFDLDAFMLLQVECLLVHFFFCWVPIPSPAFVSRSPAIELSSSLLHPPNI